MDITRNQQKNEFDDCHDHMHVCVSMYRSGLSRNNLFSAFFPTYFKGDESIYTVLS